MVCLWVAFHKNDGNHENFENDEDNSDSCKQEVECWINGITETTDMMKTTGIQGTTTSYPYHGFRKTRHDTCKVAYENDTEHSLLLTGMRQSQSRLLPPAVAVSQPRRRQEPLVKRDARPPIIPDTTLSGMLRRNTSLAIPHRKSFAAIPSLALVLLGHTNRSFKLSHESQRQIPLV